MLKWTEKMAPGLFIYLEVDGEWREPGNITYFSVFVLRDDQTISAENAKQIQPEAYPEHGEL